MDIRTLIFSVGLLNITLAMVVWIYRHTASQTDLSLHWWQQAKLIAGVGYILGWARPLFYDGWREWAYVGNLMQILGMGVEFAVYARYLGATQWIPKIKIAMVIAMPIFVGMIALPATPHPMIVYGTGVACLLYLSMALLCLQRARQSPELLKFMGVMNGLLAAVLLFKVAVGLLVQQHMQPYSATLVNGMVYTVGFLVMCVNGFGFLLLVQQQSDRALKQTLYQLTKSETSEQELLRLVAHEFRTPAAMVKVSIDSLALIDHELPVEVVRRHNNIRLAVKRMTDLADTLITRDRINSVSMTPQKEFLALDILVSNAVRYYPPDTHLHLQLTAPMAQINGDPILLRVAIQNLIDNALANSPLGNAVDISTAVGQNWCRIDVKDRGCGIPNERKSDLFTGRFSASGSLARGVGLGIVKTIAQLHDGQIMVTDHMPNGSIFSLTLPLQTIHSPVQA